MATFMKRGSTWRVLVRRRYHAPLTATFKSKREAEIWAAEREAEMAAGHYPVVSAGAKAITLAEALDRYEKTISVKKRGHTQEKVRIAQWKRTPLANRPLGLIQPADLDRWLETRQAQGVTPSTIRLDLALLRHLFNIARKRWRIVTQNPVTAIEMPAGNPPRDRIFAPGEYDRLMAALRPHMRPVVEFALQTGLRRGDIVNMRWEHIDMALSTVRLPQTKTGPRTAPLPPRAMEILHELSPKDSGSVFNLRPNSITQAFMQARKAAGLTNLRLHDMRHVATTRLMEILPAHKVRLITGHKTTAMLDRYTNPRPEDVARELAEIENHKP